jgi:hypothetical protein
VVIPPTTPGLLGKRGRNEAPALIAEVVSPYARPSDGQPAAEGEHPMKPAPKVRCKSSQERQERRSVRQSLAAQELNSAQY